VRAGIGWRRWREVMAVAPQVEREVWSKEVSCSFAVWGSIEGRECAGMTN